MIVASRHVDVFAYGEPVDMRKSFDTLAAIVKQELRRDELSGNLFLFVSKNRKRAKVLYFDGTRMWLFSKRLERGKFASVHDRARSRSVRMTLSELGQFIEGAEVIGRSPPLLTWADLTPRWGEKESSTE